MPALAVFSRPHTAGDALPPALVGSFNSLEGTAEISADLRPGQLALGNSRRLLSGLGYRGADLYVVRSAKGRICYALTGGPQGCTGGFTPSEPVGWTIFDYDGMRRGRPSAVLGLVPNEVTSVDVVVNGAPHPAKLASNAYFYELSDGMSLPEALVVGFADGTSTRIQLPEARTR